MSGVFYKDVTEYNDRLEPIRHYREQVTQLLMSRMGYSKEVADKKAVNIIKERFKDRKIGFQLRQENGDTKYTECGLATYLNTHVKARNVIAPSLTTYLPAKRKQSLWAEYTIKNVQRRAVEKKEAQEAYAKGNIELGNFKNTSQSNQKTKNNSLSGLFISTASVVVNPSAHSTLTSMTRSMTALTNANNERIMAGNRAYLTPSYALYGVINEATYCNKEAIAKTIDKYNLYIPTVDDLVDIMKYSSDLYNRDGHYYRKYVIPFLNGLTDVERCGVAYSQDLFHLWTYNPELMRKMFEDMIHKVTDKTEPMEDPTIIYKLDQAIVYYVHSLFAEEIKGMGKDYKLMNEKGIANNLYHTCLYIKNYFEEHKVFFNAFFMNEISPINSNRMQYVRRRSVTLSDTDSSGFSSDTAIKWFMGHFEVNDISVGLAGALTYISSENIVHQLSRLSTYMNVDEGELRRIAMKNEWYWPTFTTTNAAKHYFADAAIQEGNVFSEPELEIKGVHLKSSNIPGEVLSRGDDIIKEFNEGIKQNKDMSLEHYLKEAVNIENSIIESLKRGETKYLSSVNINGPDSYNGPKERSPYRHHMLWKDVFEGKYGVIEEPPYVTVKIPLTLSSKKVVDEWLETIVDQDFKGRMIRWIEANNRKDINNMNINADFITSNGFPEEIIDVIDINKVVLGMTKQLRIIITTFGVILDPDKLIQEQFIV